jgi:nucleoside-diphosphate-sugar epimerase
MSDVSVFGATGFIGSRFCELYGGIKIQRDQKFPETNNILYCISTTTNHNIYEDLHVDINTNLNVLMDVLDNCRSENITFNFVSSGFVYGSEVINASEDYYCNPKGFYSITKRTAEQMLITFCETFGVKYRIFRLANVYGNDKNCSFKKNVLGYIINQLKNNEDVNLYNSGKFKRDFIFVDDVCDAFYYLMNHSETNQVYNVSSGTPVEFKYVIEYCKDLLDSKSIIHYLPQKVSDYYLDNSKIKNLGFKLKTTLEIGLKGICFDYENTY